MNYLIVEDDDFIVRTLVPDLENAGYEVFYFDTLEEAVEWNKENQPTVVQLDGLYGQWANMKPFSQNRKLY
jgi:DNA-binding response OmpR family regulator